MTLAPADDAPATFEHIRRRLAARLREIPVFRRRPVAVPLGLDHPVWVEEDFDLDAHLHRAGLPRPGTREALEEFVSRVAELPLDRSRPLWELWVVEGLEDDRTAIVGKIHHALLDGAAGASVFAHLLDAEPDARHPVAFLETSNRDLATPSRAALLLEGARSLARMPFATLRQSLASAGVAARGVVRRLAEPKPRPAEPPRAFGGAISARRRVVLGDVPLARVREVADAFRATLNDVVLAIAAGALRRFLLERGEAPDAPLQVAIPVATARGDATRTSGNAVSAMTVELPVQLDDPVTRLARVRREMRRAKRAHAEAGDDLISGWADLAPPLVLSALTDLYAGLDLADRHTPFVNLIVSNVPGPAKPLYCAGHRVERCHPLGPIYDGCGLNLTVMSYHDRLGFGWNSCPDSLVGQGELAGTLSSSLAELHDAARARSDGERGGRTQTPRAWRPLAPGELASPATSRVTSSS